MLKRISDGRVVRAALTQQLPSLWRYAFALSGDPDKADDITQATCVRAIEKAHQFRRGDNPTGWFITICRSVWLNQLRADKTQSAQRMDGPVPLDLVDQSADVELSVMARNVFAKVMELPPAQRETVVLVYVEGFTYREAAEVMDIPIGTVMSRLSAARKKLWWLTASSDEQDRTTAVK